MSAYIEGMGYVDDWGMNDSWASNFDGDYSTVFDPDLWSVDFNYGGGLYDLPVFESIDFGDLVTPSFQLADSPFSLSEDWDPSTVPWAPEDVMFNDDGSVNWDQVWSYGMENPEFAGTYRGTGTMIGKEQSPLSKLNDLAKSILGAGKEASGSTLGQIIKSVATVLSNKEKGQLRREAAKEARSYTEGKADKYGATTGRFKAVGRSRDNPSSMLANPRFKKGGQVPGDVTTCNMGREELLRLITGQGGGQSDKITAQVSPGEYVMDADVVSAIGDGSTEEGARRLDAMRQNVRKHKRSANHREIPPKARKPEDYLE
jgi:hypothetical protein